MWKKRLADSCAVLAVILALAASCGKSGPPPTADAAPWVADSGTADGLPAPVADAAKDSSASNMDTGAAAKTATATGSATATDAPLTTATASATSTVSSTGSGTGTAPAAKTVTATGSATATGTPSKTVTAIASATATGTPSTTAIGTSTGGTGTATSTNTATSRCAAAGLVWKTANKTEFTSYPAPGSEECIKYSGCLYEGMFAGCGPTMPLSWVQSHNIVSVFPDFPTLKHHDLCLKSGPKTMVVLVIDTCADSDCSGCCTQNKGSASELIDIESFTAARFGVPDGPIQWADLGPTTGDDCPP